MAFSYNASVSDTNDAIKAAIDSRVATEVNTLSTRITSLENEATSLEQRITQLESGSTPTPTPVDATIVGHTALSLGASTTTKSVAKPAGVQAGDLLLMIVSADWGTGTALTPSTGFTQLKETDLGTNYLKINVATKVATASEPATYNVGVTTDTDARVDLIAIRNAKTAGPFPITSTTALDSTTVTSAVAPTVTPGTGRGLLICNAAVSKSQVAQYDFTFTAPTGMTELTDNNTNRWLAMSTAYQTYNSTAATGTKSFGVTTTAPRLEKITHSIVIPSAGS